MAELIRFTIRILLVFSFSLCLGSEKTGDELNSVEERNPWVIFMKDEPTRQDSNEESLRAMHLCMEEEDRKERLITCDSRYSSKFACVGAWEGNIQKCDKFKEKQVAATICVQVTSHYVVICEYKNLKPTFLCFPQKLTWINDNNLYRNFSKISSRMREDIRPCRNKERRICLERGALFPCDDLDKQESKIDDHERKLYTKTEEKIPNIYMRYESMKSGIDPFSVPSIKQNVSNHTVVFPQNDKKNTELNQDTANLLSHHKRISKFPNPYDDLSGFGIASDLKYSYSAETESRLRPNMTIDPHSTFEFFKQDKIYNKLRNKAVNLLPLYNPISKYPNPYEDISGFETGTDLKDFYLAETNSRFRPDMSNEPQSSHEFYNQDANDYKLKNKAVNFLPLQNPISKYPNPYEDASAFETGTEEKDSYLAETDSRFRPDVSNVPHSSHVFYNQDKIYSKLKNKTVKLLPLQNPISKYPNPYEDISAFETDTEEKDSYLVETDSRFRPGVSNGPHSAHVFYNQDRIYSNLKNKTVNLLPLQNPISKYPNPYEDISAFETGPEEKDSDLAERDSKFRPDVLNDPHSSHLFYNQDTIYSKLKNKTVNLLPLQNPISKYPNPYEDISAFETGTEEKDSYLAETDSRFLPDISNDRHSSHVFYNQDTSYYKLKNKTHNLLPLHSAFLKYPNPYEDMSAFETGGDLKDTPYLTEIESHFRPEMPNAPYDQRNASKYTNLKRSESSPESSADNIESVLVETKPSEMGKEYESNEANHAVDEIELARKKSELIIGGLEIPKEVKANKLNENFKLHVSIASGVAQPVSIPDDSATNQQHLKPEILNEKPRMTKQYINFYKKSNQFDRIPGELEYHPQKLLRTLEQPGEIHGKLSRQSKRPRPVTKKPSNTLEDGREYFYVLKCQHCDINHVMIVDEDAADVIPEVETFIFKP